MRRLLSARWIVGHLIVLAVCVGCVLLGFWQLDRLDERRTSNAIREARYADEPLPVSELIDQAGAHFDSLQYRRATATGVFDSSREVLIRSQVVNGQPGYDVVTPLEMGNGETIAINRGWVPLEFDTVPVTVAPPPDGETTVTGVLHLSQQGGPLNPSQDGTTFSRIDLDVIADRFGVDLAPLYLEVTGDQQVTQLPVPAAPPVFTDEGSHLGYAIQWFSFALVGIVGYGFLLRRAVRRGSDDGSREVVDDFDAREPGQVGTG